MTGQTESQHFTNAIYPDDLFSNRDGHLSEAQKISFYLFVIFWFGVAAVDIGFLVLLGYLQLHFQIGIPGFILLSVLSVVSARYCILNAIPYQVDIKNDEVKTIAGQVVKRLSFTGGSGKLSIGHCAVRVGSKVFTTSPHLYDWMENEGNYRIYYMPNTNKIINIEAL